MSEWIFDPEMNHMPRTKDMREMPIPDHVKAQLKSGDTLLCESAGNDWSWFINGVCVDTPAKSQD